MDITCDGVSVSISSDCEVHLTKTDVKLLRKSMAMCKLLSQHVPEFTAVYQAFQSVTKWLDTHDSAKKTVVNAVEAVPPSEDDQQEAAPKK